MTISLVPLYQSPDVDARILLWGSARAGKTSILYRWKLGMSIPTVDTVGCLAERFVFETFSEDGGTGKKRSVVFGPGENLAPTCSTLPTTPRPPVAPPAFMKTPAAEFSKVLKLKIEVCEIGRDPATTEVQTAYNHGGSRSLALQFIELLCCCSLENEDPASIPHKSRATGMDRSTATMQTELVKSMRRTDGVVYVVDCASERSVQEVTEDVITLLNVQRLQHTRVLILANKQDVYGSLSSEQVEQILQLPLCYNKRVRIIGCSAITGENLNDGLRWVLNVD